MARAAENALDKIDAVLPDAARARAQSVQIHARPALEMTETQRALIDQLDQATEARQRLTLSYRDAAGQITTRRVRPLGLWFWGKVWTLVAWCELREDFRVFRLDRIETLTKGAAFKPEPGKDLTAFYATVTPHPQ
ncbi:helix-turn-helix transcriptional regulator [Actibacterium sp. D379-3]